MEAEPPRTDPGPRIRLDQFLKLRGITTTGGRAKHRIQSGEVKVNGVVETRRGHHLRVGDVVEIKGRRWPVEAAHLERQETNEESASDGG